MALIQVHFKDWEKSEQLIDVESLRFKEIGNPVSVYFHQIYEEIPQDVASQLPKPMEPEKPITIILNKDLIILLEMYQ